jgi:hypothetical protein
LSAAIFEENRRGRGNWPKSARAAGITGDSGEWFKAAGLSKTSLLRCIALTRARSFARNPQ